MANVYIINGDGDTVPMERVRCKNEDRELQLILEKNPDLLPGDQIRPEDPRRWLLIKREMPVPDPGTGNDRWSVDFFFADQDAMPTFVECKRFEDTRSRREVVGQMFEYAANGHYYWTGDTLRDYAEQTAKTRGVSLEEAIMALQPIDCDSPSTYFDRVQQNLREGQVRIVFFLEESPMELRSVVDFLNKQMERSEILLVEARQYTDGDKRIVVPMLFGYTEEARQVKRSVTVSTAGSRKKWDRDSFFSDAGQKIDAKVLKSIEAFYDRCLELGFEITWGTGRIDGSFSIKKTSLSPKSILSVYSNGNLAIPFGELKGTETAEKLRDRLKEIIALKTNLSIPDDYMIRWPTYRISDWGAKTAQLSESLEALLKMYQG